MSAPKKRALIALFEAIARARYEREIADAALFELQHLAIFAISTARAAPTPALFEASIIERRISPPRLTPRYLRPSIRRAEHNSADFAAWRSPILTQPRLVAPNASLLYSKHTSLSHPALTPARWPGVKGRRPDYRPLQPATDTRQKFRYSDAPPATPDAVDFVKPFSTINLALRRSCYLASGAIRRGHYRADAFIHLRPHRQRQEASVLLRRTRLEAYYALYLIFLLRFARRLCGYLRLKDMIRTLHFMLPFLRHYTGLALLAHVIRALRRLARYSRSRLRQPRWRGSAESVTALLSAQRPHAISFTAREALTPGTIPGHAMRLLQRSDYYRRLAANYAQHVFLDCRMRRVYHASAIYTPKEPLLILPDCQFCCERHFTWRSSHSPTPISCADACVHLRLGA